MKIYKVKINGITPYMQHRMDDVKLDEWERKRGPIHERSGPSEPDSSRAEYHCYRNQSGKCYIPSDHIRGALINAGSFVKAKVGGTSKSMKTIVAAMFMVTPDQIEMPDYDAIDKRSGVNRNIKARIITIRPKWTNWEAEFTLSISNDTIAKGSIEQIIQYAGDYIGIGSFRPTNNGMFGRFTLNDIQEIMYGAAEYGQVE
jgi:hypothetical protein